MSAARKMAALAALAAIALALALTGCDTAGSDTSPPDFFNGFPGFTASEDTIAKTSDARLREEYMTLSDGRVVTCISWKTAYAGGLSCDWENTK